MHHTCSIARSSKMASKFLLLAAVAAICFVAVDARVVLQAPKSADKSTRKVFDDPNGGVAPLEERVAAAAVLFARRQALLDAQAECRKNKDYECKAYYELKKQQAAEKAKEAADKKKKDDEKKAAEAKASGVPVKAAEPKPKEVKAPCKQNVVVTYFLGTTCIPATEFDVRPPPKKP